MGVRLLREFLPSRPQDMTPFMILSRCTQSCSRTPSTPTSRTRSSMRSPSLSWMKTRGSCNSPLLFIWRSPLEFLSAERHLVGFVILFGPADRSGFATSCWGTTWAPCWLEKKDGPCHSSSSLRCVGTAR